MLSRSSFAVFPKMSIGSTCVRRPYCLHLCRQYTIGLVLLDKNNDEVIAIRGTEGIFEWVHDALYLQKPCPFAGGIGNTTTKRKSSGAEFQIKADRAGRHSSV
jgi:hypothetical protein